MSYDARLLDHAPEVTRQDRQEGYNVDILDKGQPLPPTRQSSLPTSVDGGLSTTAHHVPGAPYSIGHSHEKALPLPGSAAPTRPPRFYNTLKGRIILLIVGFVVVAAVVGGAVGGSLGKGDKKGITLPTGNESENPNGQGNDDQAQGGASGTSGAATSTAIGIGVGVGSPTSVPGAGSGGGATAVSPSPPLVPPSSQGQEPNSNSDGDSDEESPFFGRKRR